MLKHDETSLNHERLMRVDEVAAYLQVPVKTLYRWRHHGTGPGAIRVGRYLRYRRSEIAAWLNEESRGQAC